MKVPVSILIPIKNEAANLARCLPSVAWADEIFVVDSQSTDGSIGLAEAAGARVVQFQFNGLWPKKKNWALDHLPFSHEWVFILDADEVLPPEAEAEIQEIVTAQAGSCAGYWINRRFLFMGKWLKHAYYPNWNLRLFQHRLGRYEQLVATDTASGDNEVHEHIQVQGQTGFLRSEMDHFAFPSVDVFVEKHNRYSNWEARVALAGLGSNQGDRSLKTNVKWRRRLKRLSHHLPFRPLLRFLYVYVWQRGFLDGWEGYYFARLHGFYEFLSVTKTFELKKSRDQASPPARTFGLSLDALVKVAFWTSLGVVLFYTLRPSLYGERVHGMPRAVASWIKLHDGASNVLMFVVLGSLGFWYGWRPRPTAADPIAGLSPVRRNRRCLRMIGFLGLVALLELAQVWIPGRVCDWQDIAAGWAGILIAWLLWDVLAGSAGAKPASARPNGAGAQPASGEPNKIDPAERASSLRINVWGINYSPELTGIAPYNTALCEHLREAGHEVRMVTTFAYYPAWRKLPSERGSWFRTDDLAGVQVHRCWHYVPLQVTTCKRIIHEASFVLISFLRQLTLPRPDVLIVVSPPLLLGAAAWLLAKVKRAPFVFHVQDLQPGAAAELGMIKNRWLIRSLYWLETFAYKKAALVSGITPGMLEAFGKKGVEKARRLHFPNAVLLPDLSRLPAPGGFRRAHDFADDDFLVVYSGNLGVKQGLEGLIEAARRVDNPKVRFVICGEGSQREQLLRRLEEQRLSNVHLLPLQPRDRYHELLADADLCVIPQQPGSGGYFFPSKLLMTLAFAKPVLAIADDASELVQALQEGPFGVHVPPGQPEACAALINGLSRSRDGLKAFGQAGRLYVEQFETSRVLGRFEAVLRQLAELRKRETVSQPTSAEKPFARPFAP